MTLDVVQSMALLIIGLLAIVILLRILFVVHRQTGKFKELEDRMKMMEHTEEAEVLKESNDEEGK